MAPCQLLQEDLGCLLGTEPRPTKLNPDFGLPVSAKKTLKLEARSPTEPPLCNPRPHCWEGPASCRGARVSVYFAAARTR